MPKTASRTEPGWTPGPWTVEDDYGSAYRIAAYQGLIKVYPARAHGLADAHRIVQCVNAHDDLVEALAEIVAWATDDAATAWPKAHAALAKARGETP
jgi:hypothetical protein